MGIREIVGGGDEDQILVRVQGTGDYHKHIMIFRIRRNDQDLTSISSRAVACFYNDVVDSEDYTFEDRATMRAVLRDAIDQAWLNCLSAADLPDAVMDLSVDAYGHATWEVQRESELYQEYRDQLAPLSSILSELPPEQSFDFVEQTELIGMHPTTSSLASELVRRTDGPASQSLYVRQHIRFLDALESWPLFLQRRDLLYSTIRRLHAIPAHAHILPPPTQFTTTCSLITGILLPHHPTLESARPPSAIPRAQKALWFSQLTSALLHAHTAGFHPLNLHPGTLQLSSSTHLLLSDWANSSASRATLAPEADGTWTPTTGALYTPYSGPARRNIPVWPGWDVFAEWSHRWPRAAEAATVFAAARTVWIVLAGDEGPLDWDLAPDTPLRWREVVELCLHEDPNARMRLRDLAGFWGREVQRQKG